MSDYRQAQENEEWHRWWTEQMEASARRLAKMEQDVERGKELLRELEQTSNERNHSRAWADEHGEAEGKGQRSLVFP